MTEKEKQEVGKAENGAINKAPAMDRDRNIAGATEKIVNEGALTPPLGSHPSPPPSNQGDGFPLQTKEDWERENANKQPPVVTNTAVDPSTGSWPLLDSTVFPSTGRTIRVEHDSIYGGAHKYIINNCLGFIDGDTHYDASGQEIQFVQKNDDGSIIPGLQSEQLALVMIDRAKKLNARFPSEHNEKQIKGLEMFLEGCKDRVEERINRGVMGNLEK